MNKTAIKNFAVWARNKLIADIKYRAGLVGVTEAGIASALPQSTGDTEFFDIGTIEPYVITGEEVKQRKKLVDILKRRLNNSDYITVYNALIEEVAYTWFNRLIAVRFMEVNDYLPNRIRVLSSETGKMEPDIVTNPFDSELIFSNSEMKEVQELKRDGRQDAADRLFRKLFIKQCNYLSDYLPVLFEKTNDYTELLLNISYIDREGIVFHLINDIEESCFDIEQEGQVEIIGWLYQYYNAELKDETFALLKKKQKITKERIPSATQLFTPDWIVRYMVENSLGRLWSESHTNFDTSEWEYYLEEATQEAKVQEQLEQLREKGRKLNPEEIKCIDPCMGSGHILVYMFDVLMQIYDFCGYSARESVKSIVENNIFGLDIDERAAQLAYFAVMMKARQYDRRFLTRKDDEGKPDVPRMNVFSIQESNELSVTSLKEMGVGFSENDRKTAVNQLTVLMNSFRDAKEYGVILDIPKYDFNFLKKYVNSISDEGQIDFNIMVALQEKEIWLKLIDIAELMTQKYHVVITNPPYMGGGNMNAKLSAYVKDNYPDTKTDLFAVCIQKGNEMTLPDGYNCMVTMQSWMFLGSFEKMRIDVLENKTITNLMHMDNMVMGIAFGTAVTVFRNSRLPGYRGTYNQIKLSDIVDGKPKEFPVLENRFFQVSIDGLAKIPGMPVAYWISDNVIRMFDNKNISDVAVAKTGLQTGNNDKFLKLWYEVNYQDIDFNATQDSMFSNKWYPHVKGGDYRKWYGNYQYVIWWKDNGAAIKAEKGAVIRSPQFYFFPGITWSHTTSGGFSGRLLPKHFVINVESPSIFNSKNPYYLMGLLNSKVGELIFEVMNSTMHYLVGNVAKVPVKIDYEKLDRIEDMVKENIELSKDDWDSVETSWEFKKHPLIDGGCSIEEAFLKWENDCQKRFEKMKNNEETLNRMFIDIYGLEGEVCPEIEDRYITVNKASAVESIKGLISYAVGCMFGRYSLDVPGISYAGGNWKQDNYCSFVPDSDNCIPIADEEYFEDDIVGRFVKWVKVVYGEKSLECNLDYIANVLGNKGNTSREVIRNYFLNDYYKDHCNLYSVTGAGKRPIYWLFDSGKQNGFKALVYMHRWNQDTMGVVNADYLLKIQRVYESEIKRMQDIIDNSANSREVAAANKRKEKLQKQLKETRDYYEKLSHLALERISLDADSGVKQNYEKVQTGADGKKYPVLAGI